MDTILRDFLLSLQNKAQEKKAVVAIIVLANSAAESFAYDPGR